MSRDYARERGRRPSRRQEEDEGGRNWRWPLAGILVVLFIVAVFYLKQQSAKLAAEQGDQGESIIQQTMKQNIPGSTAAKPAVSKTTGKTTATPATQTTTTAPAAAPQPKFDFYTMLPNGQQSANTNNTAAKPATTQATTTNNTAPAPATTQAQPTATPAATNTVAATPATTTTSNNANTTPPVVKQPSHKELEKNTQTDTSDLIAMEIQKLNTDKTKATADSTAPAAKTSSQFVLQLGSFKNYNDADQLKAQLILQGLDVIVKEHKKANTTLYHVIMGPYPSLAAAKKQQHQLEENQVKSKIVKE